MIFFQIVFPKLFLLIYTNGIEFDTLASVLRQLLVAGESLATSQGPTASNLQDIVVLTSLLCANLGSGGTARCWPSAPPEPSQVCLLARAIAGPAILLFSRLR